MKALGDAETGIRQLKFSVSKEEAFCSLKDSISEINSQGLIEPIISPEVALKVFLHFSKLGNCHPMISYCKGEVELQIIVYRFSTGLVRISQVQSIIWGRIPTRVFWISCLVQLKMNSYLWVVFLHGDLIFSESKIFVQTLLQLVSSVNHDKWYFHFACSIGHQFRNYWSTSGHLIQ